MDQLPSSERLDIGALSRLYDNTSASYKFLLFKSILESVHTGNTRLAFDDLAMRSIAAAWYSIHFYKLSYGHSDRMTRWVDELDRDMKDRVLISDLSYHHIYSVLKDLKREDFPSLDKFIREFVKLVPYRLITPWFGEELKGLADSKKNAKITELSLRASPYRLLTDEKEGLVLDVRDEWADYLRSNYSIINGWHSFHFLHYLQKRNPTVLSLATKLAPPQERNMNLVKKLFKDFFGVRKDLKRCLYTGVEISGSISHDHFFPWSFLGSDPLYNFVPTTREVNSAKSNIIPDHSLIQKVSNFQFEFFDFLRKASRNKALEFYINDLGVREYCEKTEFNFLLEAFYEPLFLTAKNQGFEMGWKA
ncbi:MAG: hypothetical protein CME60_05915 [Halobacteriovoraceae bacterium]|nr:hypothetical protein [Halobacteriovoraceae bacterium]|tara:strand:- start:202 stop:1290 length:1089 start_codon:yes stop_codon:yes gene_type:complete